jgi:hypothetical protein
MAVLLKRYLVPLLFGALALYPCYFAVSTVLDHFQGEKQLLSWLLFDSKHTLALRFFNDWRDSAPIAIAFALAGLLPVLFVARRRLAPPLIGLALAAALIAGMLHFAPLQIALVVGTALVNALFTLLLAKGFSRART